MESSSFLVIAQTKIPQLQKMGVTSIDRDVSAEGETIVVNYSPHLCSKKLKSCEALATKMCKMLETADPFVIRVTEGPSGLSWFYMEEGTVQQFKISDLGKDDDSKPLSNLYRIPNLTTVVLKAIVDSEEPKNKSCWQFWRAHW